MQKRSLALGKVYGLLEPGPVLLLSTCHKGRANVMAMSWHTMMDFEPPLVGCVVSARDFSFAALKATRECVLNIPAAELAAKVVTVEIIEELHLRARHLLLMELGYRNITLVHSASFGDTGDGFDAVVVAACADMVPEELIARLAPGGSLVLPVESAKGQVIKKIVKGADGKVFEEEYGEALFVPLVR